MKSLARISHRVLQRNLEDIHGYKAHPSTSSGQVQNRRHRHMICTFKCRFCKSRIQNTGVRIQNKKMIFIILCSLIYLFCLLLTESFCKYMLLIRFTDRFSFVYNRVNFLSGQVLNSEFLLIILASSTIAKKQLTHTKS